MARTPDWIAVPIREWPGDPNPEPQPHPFRYKPHPEYHGTRPGVSWSKTTDLLARELDELDATNIVLQLWLTNPDHEIRNDGWIRADARPRLPGVILQFDSRYGFQSYAVDTFDDWQANVYAIAVALEDLRRISRYGVAPRGEQYQGFGRLPPAGGSTATLSAHEAAGIVLNAPGAVDPDAVGFDALKEAARNRVRETHPDAGGTPDAFDRVMKARQRLSAHFGARV